MAKVIGVEPTAALAGGREIFGQPFDLRFFFKGGRLALKPLAGRLAGAWAAAAPSRGGDPGRSDAGDGRLALLGARSPRSACAGGR